VGSGYFKGTPVSREFLYVEDAAEAIALAADRYDGAEPVNVGAGREVPINDLIAMVCEMTNYRGKVVRDLTKPTASPAGAWTSPARRRSSASSPARRSRKACAGRSRGTSRRDGNDPELFPTASRTQGSITGPSPRPPSVPRAHSVRDSSRNSFQYGRFPVPPRCRSARASLGADGPPLAPTVPKQAPLRPKEGATMKKALLVGINRYPDRATN